MGRVAFDLPFEWNKDRNGMAKDVSDTLQALAELQERPLSIIRLSEPFSASLPSTRTSDVSTSALDNPTPASLEADLSHYKVPVLSQASLERNC